MGNILSWFSLRNDDFEGGSNGFPFISETSTLAFNRAFGIKSNSVISKVHVHVSENSIILELELTENLEVTKPVEIKFETHDQDDKRGSLVSCANFKKFPESMYFVEVFWEIFEMILRAQKSILNVLEIDFSHDIEAQNEIFNTLINNILKTLDYRSSPLQVVKFSFAGPKTNPFPKILNFLYPEILKSISLYDPMEQYEKLDFTDIVKLDQWKNTEEIRLHGYDLEWKIEDFEHFLIMDFSVKKISIEDLVMFQKAFLNSSTMNHCEIKYQEFLSEPPLEIDQLLVTTFGKPEISTNHLGQIEKKWHFRNKECMQIVLIKIVENVIFFERIELSDASDYVIVVL